MKARYTSIYKLRGANRLPEEAESIEVLASPNPSITATLTTNSEPYFLHVDKSAALGTLLLKGIFAPDKEGTLQERLAAEIEDARARRSKLAGTGVFLVFDGEIEIPSPEFEARRDTDEFSVSLDAIAKPQVREKFEPSIQNVIAALSLNLPGDADRKIEKIGEVVYLLDPDSGKPIYAFSFRGGHARMSVASRLTQSAIRETAVLASKLSADNTLTRPKSLLVTSLDEAIDGLQGFIAAWSALEIFVNATFKATYEERWFQIMEHGAPASARPVFERFQNVMSDKYRLSDKFLVIASVLDSASAVDDGREFSRLKKIRDGLLHALDTPSSPLPTHAVQKLLFKYLKLHLDAPP